MPSKTTAVKNSTILFVYLFIVWGLYRYFFQLPEDIEQIVVKPLLWIPPVLFLLKREKLGLSSVGFNLNKLFPAIYFALCLGTVFSIEGLLVNYLKYGFLNFNANLGSRAFIYTLGLSLMTAIPEEIAFRGFIFNRLLYALGNEWTAGLITSIAWIFVSAPVAIFTWKMELPSLVIYLFLSFLYSFGACFIFARTKNVLAPILLHVFWEWPIILFR